MKLLTFNKYYEGEFGDLEGPITTVIGLYDNEEDIKQAKITSELVEIEFETQYGAAKDHFELTDLPLNTMVHTPYSVRKKKWLLRRTGN